MPIVAIVASVLAVVWTVVGAARVVRDSSRRRGRSGGSRGDWGDRAFAAAQAWGAQGTPPWSKTKVLGLVFEGRAFRMAASAYGKARPTRLSLTTNVERAGGSAFRASGRASTVQARLPAATFSAETSRDILGKRLGLNAEIQTGDAAFDDAVYVEPDTDAALVEELLQLPEVRSAIAAAVDDRTSVVTNHEGRQLALSWQSEDAPIDRQALGAAMAKLAAVAEAWPAVSSLEPAPSVGTTAIVVGCLLAALSIVSIAAATTAFQMFLPLGDGFQTVGNVAMGVAIALGLALAWHVSRRRARGLQRFFCLVAFAFGILPWDVGTALALGNALGIEPDQRIPTRVLSVSQTRGGKGGTVCYAKLAPWRKELAGTDVKIACSQYDHALTRPSATALVGRGRFGWQWVDSVELGPPPPHS